MAGPPKRSAVPAPESPDPGGWHGDGLTRPASSSRFLLFTAVPSWLISLLLHMAAILILAFVSWDSKKDEGPVVIRVAGASEVENLEDFVPQHDIAPLSSSQLRAEPRVQLTVETPAITPDVGLATDLQAAPLAVDLSAVGDLTAPPGDLMKSVGLIGGTGLEGRGRAARGQMLAKYGGTPASEEAVELALRWFAEHQLQDGSWSFDHTMGSCAGRCPNPGVHRTCYTGATAMALLAFLGAGETHKEGQYKNTVAAGLAYLVRSMGPNGSLMQGPSNTGMYAHGMASIVLCEAYGMTHDRQLAAPAQASLNFIAYAQDPVGGGWRYLPRQPGDTSVLGWQLMALKSGQMAYLRVLPQTLLGVNRFLNSVQADGGAKYGYTVPSTRPSTTSIGLLCRMYLGWKKDHAPLERGIAYLSGVGPSPTDMYYNYYATQVMRHYGGADWEKWNSVMRDQLVNSQSKSGHSRGSWYFDRGAYASSGGRLYFTSMATMILEVYYRHMPIYGTRAAEDEFPL